MLLFFFSSRRRHTRCGRDWSSDVCSSDLGEVTVKLRLAEQAIIARVGPFASGALSAELERDPSEGVNLRRVLGTVVDGYKLDPEGWLELIKHVERQEAAS